MAKKKQQTKEQIYDAQIHPLMAQVIAICKQHSIPVVFSCHLGDELHCTTVLLDETYDPSDAQEEAAKCFYPPPSPVTMITTRDGEGKITRMDAIVG